MLKYLFFLFVFLIIACQSNSKIDSSNLKSFVASVNKMELGLSTEDRDSLYGNISLLLFSNIFKHESSDSSFVVLEELTSKEGFKSQLIKRIDNYSIKKINENAIVYKNEYLIKYQKQQENIDIQTKPINNLSISDLKYIPAKTTNENPKIKFQIKNSNSLSIKSAKIILQVKNNDRMFYNPMININFDNSLLGNSIQRVQQEIHDIDQNRESNTLIKGNASAEIMEIINEKDNIIVNQKHQMIEFYELKKTLCKSVKNTILNHK